MSNHTTQQNHASSNNRARCCGSQSGIALILAIVGLLVITTVAAGMILVETSETSVDANYREQQVALLAAKAGLQEARDRMLSSNFATLNLPCELPGGTATSTCGKTGFASTYATYITATGVTPWLSGSTVNRVSVYDTEFAKEMGLSTLPSGTWYGSYTSNTNYSGPAANPLAYQWVRINLKTNRSAFANNGTYYVNASQPATNQVMYDSGTETQCVSGTLAPSPCATSSTLGPVYELTSFALTRTGATALVQDEVAAQTFNLNLNSPLTIPGTVGSFSGGNSNNYQIDGIDGQGSAPAIAGCTANSSGGPAVAVSNNGSATTVKNGLPRPTHYTGNSCSYYSGSNGCVGSATLSNTMGTPAELEATLSEIKQAANACVNCSGTTGGTYSYSDIVSALGGSWSNSSDNPQVVYVNGDLDISSATGSGILVVTGNLNYNGASGWNGVILVVGQGTTTYNVNGGGNGQFDGAVFVATTRDASGNILPSYGTSDFNINGGGGSGIFYNSCWINQVQKPVTYVMLSAKQIPN